MKRACFGVAVGIVICLGAARADDAETFKGTWKFTSINAGGKPVPDAVTKTLELKLSKDELVLSGSGIKEAIKSKVVLDEKAKTFDFEPTSGPEKGTVSKGLYDLKTEKTDAGEKTTLRIYFGKPGQDRPKKIEDKVAEGHFLWVLEKTK